MTIWARPFVEEASLTDRTSAHRINPQLAVVALCAIGGMVAVIAWGSLLALNYLHVMSAVLWTGVDLFMGFVVGPVLRAAPFEARREVMLRLTPRTIFLLPTLAILTGTTGWYLAQGLGYLDLAWPAFGWVVAALALVTIMTVQGLGYLLPTQIRVWLELRKDAPDGKRIMRLTRAYFWVIASQGLLQVLTIFVMARFRMGL